VYKIAQPGAFSNQLGRFILQGAIIFGVFCWIGQHVDYVAEPEMKKAAAVLGGLVAFAVSAKY
jgi:hypothetical protein